MFLDLVLTQGGHKNRINFYDETIPVLPLNKNMPLHQVIIFLYVMLSWLNRLTAQSRKRDLIVHEYLHFSSWYKKLKCFLEFSGGFESRVCLTFSNVIQLCRSVAQFHILMDQVHGKVVLSTPIML